MGLSKFRIRGSPPRDETPTCKVSEETRTAHISDSCWATQQLWSSRMHGHQLSGSQGTDGASIQLGRWVKSVEVGLVSSWIVTSGRITHSNFFDTISKHKLLNRTSKSKSRTAALDTKLSVADGNMSKVSQYQAHLNVYISRNCNRHKYHILPEGTPKQYTLYGFSRVEKKR